MTKERILIADDCEMICELLASALAKNGAEIVCVTSGERAKAELAAGEFDLVIADLAMPPPNGLELLRWCRREKGEIPFVIMSGMAESQHLVEVLNNGADYFIVKPFAISHLQTTVESALAKSRLRRQEAAMRRQMADEISRMRQQLVDEMLERERLFLATLSSLAAAVDARDQYTCRHSTAVAEYAMGVGGVLGLDANSLAEVRIAGQLHDIGKIGVPEAILNKPSALSEEEFSCIRAHPDLGARILSPLPGLSNVISAVRSHHERFDGKGYPDGLGSGDIPKLARLLAVCDAWDAMRTDRPYRLAISEEKALGIIKEQSGRQFDPQMVEAFFAFREKAKSSAAETLAL